MSRNQDDELEFFDDEEDAPRSKKSKKTSPAKSNTTLLIVICLGGVGMLTFCICGMIALLLPAVQQAREAARRTDSKNNLFQIGLANHNFESLYGHFPPKDLAPGEVRQSWLTYVLPFIESSPLYNQINQQVAWDDPSNQTAMKTYLPIFNNPSVASPPVDPTTGYALSHYAGSTHIYAAERAVKISDILDGTFNTIMAGSIVGSPKPWGDPGNLRDPAAGIGMGPDQYMHGAAHSGGTHFLMCDGAVRFVSQNVDAETLKRLATINDGLVIGDF